MSDLKPEQQQMLNTKQPFPANQTLAIPCGLVAKSQFNDEFILWKVDPVTKEKIKKVDINRKNIAWQSDIKYKFNNTKMETVPKSYLAKFNEDVSKVTYKDI